MTQTSADVVGAASLLVTSVTVLFGLWYRDVHKATQIELPTFRPDASNTRARIVATIKWQVVPLLAGSFLVAVAFLPVLLSDLWRSLQIVRQHGLGAWRYYDASVLTLLAVFSLAVLLGWRTARFAVALVKKVNRIDDLPRPR